MSQSIVVLEADKLHNLIKEAVSAAILSTPSLSRDEKPKMFLTTGEVATMLHVTSNALRIQRTHRTGIPFIKDGKRVLYRYQDVIDHMEAHRVKVLN